MGRLQTEIFGLDEPLARMGRDRASWMDGADCLSPLRDWSSNPIPKGCLTRAPADRTIALPGAVNAPTLCCGRCERNSLLVYIAGGRQTSSFSTNDVEVLTKVEPDAGLI